MVVEEMKKRKRILFICKKRMTTYGISYGLLNSARFVASALRTRDMEARVVEVIDNNDIDREVTLYRPTHVIIEALWVVPEKFFILKKLHPNVRWIVRIHSKVPFLATDSVAMSWIVAYRANDVEVAFNNDETYLEAKLIFGTKIFYLPNIYTLYCGKNVEKKSEDSINIGCFGAVRLLKNHLQQAMAAILFANKIDKKLNFYINSTDIEDSNNSVVKNLKDLFYYSNKHTLIRIKWLPHNKFIELIKTMDIGMQVSMSESFNVVAADFVSLDIPIVVSDEIDWIPFWYRSKLDVLSIYDKLRFAWGIGRFFELHRLNKMYLNCHNNKAIKEWLHFLRED